MSDRWAIHHGDCREVMRAMEPESIDSIVSDPPYGLSFMGKGWDHGVPGVEFWEAALRVAKPGAHLLAFGGTRTFHRLTVAIEDAGWDIRDCLMWVYGSGFPKSHDVSKAIDKRGGASVAWFGPWFRKWREDNGVTQKQVAALFPSKSGGLTGCVANWELGFNMPTPEQFNLIRDTFGLPFDSVEEAEREVVGIQKNAMSGWDMDGGTKFVDRNITAPATDAARQWSGWGTALKPSHEPVILARKPLSGTVAANVLEHGTGALNVDGCRVASEGGAQREGEPSQERRYNDRGATNFAAKPGPRGGDPTGRWPANLIHDGSDEVVGLMAEAARFFYCAKASKRDRDEGCEGLPQVVRACGPEGHTKNATAKTGELQRLPRGNHHPTVKPTDLMRYLCRLVTPPDGLVFDPFTGSGSTGKAAMLEGFRFVGAELSPEYIEIARARIGHAAGKTRQKELALA